MEKNICIVILLLYGLVMLAMCYIAIFSKSKKPNNNVHFYVARDKDGRLWLYIGKPIRNDVEFHTKNKKAFVLTHYLKLFGLKYEDYANLKWEDEPVEVFINMED